MKAKVLLSWSSGKDSAWTLHVLRQHPDVEIVGLLTTINSHFQRVAMHGTRYELLKMQAATARLPLWEIPLPWPCSNEVYEQAMAAACTSAVQEGISAIAFGDLFLKDVRRYREDRLRGTGLDPLFPLWNRNTRELIFEMIDGGLQARMVCVDPAKMPADFAGRDLDHKLIERLPESVDPCGENGEFHTFAYGGPMFREPIPIETGECVTRDGFVFADVLLQPHVRLAQTCVRRSTIPLEYRYERTDHWCLGRHRLRTRQTLCLRSSQSASGCAEWRQTGAGRC